MLTKIKLLAQAPVRWKSGFKRRTAFLDRFNLRTQAWWHGGRVQVGLSFCSSRASRTPQFVSARRHLHGTIAPW